MQTWIYYYLALHCFICWGYSVNAAIFVWNGLDYDRFESISNFEGSDRVYQCNLFLSHNTHYCTPKTNSSLLPGNFDARLTCIALLLTNDNDDDDNCDMAVKVQNADDWLNTTAIAMGTNFTPILILADPSVWVVDNATNVTLDFPNTTSSLLVHVSYITGLALAAKGNIHGYIPDVRITWEPPKEDSVEGESDDDEDDGDDEEEDDEPQSNRGGLGRIPAGALALLVFIALMVLSVGLCNCGLWSVGMKLLFRGGDPPQAPTAATATPTPVTEEEKVLTASQINQLVNASLDNDARDASKKLSTTTTTASTTQACAICIEDCDADSTIGSLILTLPCRHKFHSDCIVPWLTRNKGECPLCKDNVLGRVDRQATLLEM